MTGIPNHGYITFSALIGCFHEKHDSDAEPPLAGAIEIWWMRDTLQARTMLIDDAKLCTGDAPQLDRGVRPYRVSGRALVRPHHRIRTYWNAASNVSSSAAQIGLANTRIVSEACRGSGQGNRSRFQHESAACNFQ